MISRFEAQLSAANAREQKQEVRIAELTAHLSANAERVNRSAQSLSPIFDQLYSFANHRAIASVRRRILSVLNPEDPNTIVIAFEVLNGAAGINEKCQREREQLCRCLESEVRLFLSSLKGEL
jgi:hypothetical protein